jgi:predicted RNase H-like HicB family nuclease
MQRVSVELIPDPEFGGYTARLPDIPAYGEGETEQAAIADLREAIRGYVEAFGEMAEGYRAEAERFSLDLEWSEIETEGL